tara:strand:- start:132 stop:893 length:762 start_codon:yes stop_codon:yes gene_type:complete
MSKANSVINEFMSLMPYTEAAVYKAFNDKLAETTLAEDGVQVDFVEMHVEGGVTVGFSDQEGDEIDVLFSVEEGDATATVLPDDELDEDITEIQLNGVAPNIVTGHFAEYVQLDNLDWMTKNTLHAILVAGDVGRDGGEVITPEGEPIFVEAYTEEEIESMDEEEKKKRFVAGTKVPPGHKKVGTAFGVKAGKKVKGIMVVRKKALTGAKKMIAKKAARKRTKTMKGKKAQVARKRKKSLKIRKRLGLTKSKK